MTMVTRTFIVNGETITREVRDNTVHVTSVQWFENNHGYPYRGECSTCEWKSRGMMTRSAARDLATEHMLNA